MSKTSKLKFVLAGNIPQEKKSEVVAPEEPIVEVEEPSVEESKEEPFEESEEKFNNPLDLDTVKENKNSTEVNYGTCTKPIGKAKENGIILCVVLCVLLLLCLGLLFYQNLNHSSPTPDNNDTVVEPEYKDLIIIIKGYVSAIKDSKKAEFCKKLRDHYIQQANTPVTDINTFLEDNIESTRSILGFYNRSGAISNEYEWHKLFCKGGVIDKWLEDRHIVVTPENKKGLFLAIAEGLE